MNSPVILTIPAYPNSYSMLQLDVYGNIFSTELSSTPPSGGGIHAETFVMTPETPSPQTQISA